MEHGIPPHRQCFSVSCNYNPAAVPADGISNTQTSASHELCAAFQINLRNSRNILALVLLLALFSCDRMKNKGEAVVDKTMQTATDAEQVVSDKAKHLVDKVFPVYDNGKADAEYSKRLFKEHLQVDATSEIKDIYAYADFLGADYKILIAFTCDQAIIDKIIFTKKMQLTSSKDDDGLLFVEEFKWWDKDKIELLEPYKVGREAEYWQYLWYDPKTRQAFFEEFSL